MPPAVCGLIWSYLVFVKNSKKKIIEHFSVCNRPRGMYVQQLQAAKRTLSLRLSPPEMK